MEMIKDREVWWFNLEELLPRNPHDEKEGNEDRENFSLKLSLFSTVSLLVAFVQTFHFINQFLHCLKHS